jgi:hypothetical protein
MAVTSTTSSNTQLCQVCRQACIKRCQTCRSVYYCSVACQRKDWKGGHRKLCRAWNELSHLFASSTLAEAQHDYYKACDEVQRLEKDEESKKKKILTTVKKNDNNSQQTPKPTTFPATDHFASEKKDPPLRRNYRDLEDGNRILYSVEDMPNLSCYYILVQNTTLSLLDDDKVSVHVLPPNILVVQFDQDNVLRLELPRTITTQAPPVHSVVQLVDHQALALSIRLSYTHEPHSSSSTTTTTRPQESPQLRLLQPQELNRLACSSCGQLLVKDNSIHDVFPLPSSQWENMEEYLTCCSSSPDVFLSGTPTAQRHRVLQDATAVVLHADDFLATSTCVLACVPSYGSQDDPNPNAWWSDVASGATLTCSLCATVLGSVTLNNMELDTYRLLQHPLALSTLARFVANELVRYAETSAVFCFSVVTTGSSNRRLVVQLVSWSTQAAQSEKSQVVVETGVHELSWCRMAKLFWETTTNNNTDDGDGATANANTLSWDTDWCCRENNNNMRNDDPQGERPVSEVRLCLSPAEWDELRKELMQASRLQAREVVEATILAKTGKLVTLEDDGIGLATIPL